MKSRMSLNLSHLGSKTKSLGQIKETPCGHSRGHSFCSIDLKISQDVCLDKISDEFEFRSTGSKTRSPGQNKEITCGRSRGHIFCSIDLKTGQNVCLDAISEELEFRSHWVKN